VEQAKTWRHRYGGQIYQQWPTALSALAGMERELPRLGEYVAHAKLVAGAIAEVFGDVFGEHPGARVHPEPPHTHQFQVWLPFPAALLNETGMLIAEETGQAVFPLMWREPGLPGLSFTELTVAGPALEWSTADVRTAVGEFLARVAAAAK
jgi:hypothetical protein